MTTSLLGQIALGVILAACLAAAYKLGAFVTEKRCAFEEGERQRRAEALGARPPRPAWISALQPAPGTAGFTIAAALNGVGCLGRSRADEPVFVLCARDRAASAAVRGWADVAEGLGSRPAKLSDARALADRMDEWRAATGGGKVPD